MKRSTEVGNESDERDHEGSEMPFIGASGECCTQIASDDPPRSGSIGIGLDPGASFIPGGARSGELLQLFIENL